jgi:hypothetical protein
MTKLNLPTGADPHFGWTPEKIKQYIEERPLQAGDMMLIVNRQAGFEEYILAKVVDPSSGRQRRVVLDRAAAWGGTSFYRTGKNCFSPTGQSRMIPPVEEVLNAMKSDTPGATVMSQRHYGVSTTKRVSP